jgi:K+-transporting ATPase KdpF subunit
MNALDVVAAVLSLLIFVYLLWALLRPEDL